MCGLTGFWQQRGFPALEAKATAATMAHQIAHRGPDDFGVWVDADAGLALAFRRLSILDLSSAGHQPMASASGRYVLVFNGEIYNYLQLRSELEGLENFAWRGRSDTETLLAGFETWGVDTTLKKSVGMFAIALWDREERSLTLARDRMGEKPLYYGWQNGALLFGSELKALRAHPSFLGEIDRNALTLLLRHNCIPAPYSIYCGIYKLLPGTYLKLSSSRRESKPIAYWSLREVVTQGQTQLFAGSEAEAVEELETHLRAAVRSQMIADVPLGAFLSGGVDSSTIVALMQAQSDRPVKTFTIGFHHQRYNEAEYATAVARHLGTEHTELYVTPEDAMSVIPRLPVLYDEPFADSSQISTFLVSQLAKQHVTVALSGDAGDELFGGYNRYSWAAPISRLARTPKAIRATAETALRTLSPRTWDRLYNPISGLLPSGLRITLPGDKAHKLADVMAECGSREEIYRGLVSHWKYPADVVIGAAEPSTMLTAGASTLPVHGFEHRMMYLDAMSYLPDDILVKVDRAAMGVGLESRIPFLDHRVVDFAWRLPLSMKIRHGQGKWLLRQVLYKYVPKELIERPKMGFGVPIDSWLRGPLHDWAEDLLDETRLRQGGFFHPSPIRHMWAEHLSGHRNLQYPLWDVLTFQSWLQNAQDASYAGECLLQSNLTRF